MKSVYLKEKQHEEQFILKSRHRMNLHTNKAVEKYENTLTRGLRVVS